MRAPPAACIGEHDVIRVSATDARCLHRAGGSKIGRAEADAVHPWRCGRDVGDVIDPFGSLQDGMDEDRFRDRVFCLQLGKELVEVVDVPSPFHLRQHDHIELRSDRGDDLDHVIEKPWRIERVDTRPQPGRSEVVRPGHGDESGARSCFGVGRNCVLKIAQHYVHLRDQLRNFGAQFLDMRRDKMNHAFQLDRKFA